jgi:predicted ATP-grasp superfamily ATP-dependent carboligase
VLQEVVDGPLRAHVTVVGHDGRPAARLLQEATALYPPRAGITVRGRTLEIDEVVAARAEAMLADLGWFGLAELQYLTGPDGRAHMIDLNGRFYGSLALALGAGVNLPAVWGALALGGSAEAVVDGRPGVLYQWLEGDLRRARVERRGGLLRDVAGCLIAAPGRVHSIWSVRDPLPAVRYAAHLAARRAVRGAS